MMQGAQSANISAGRLHLHHGPIDLIINAGGQDKDRAFSLAELRFQTVLGELVQELDLLRSPSPPKKPKGKIAVAMANAVARHAGTFVTPMAAVAGAVADEVLAAMCRGTNLSKAYVNNGGDIAVYLSPGHSLTAAAFDGATVTLHDHALARGIATSGWQGRSHSLGIADAVTVTAKTAARADVAATLIANAVNLPGHPAVSRTPASAQNPDSDLGDTLITADVGHLAPNDIQTALAKGEAIAQNMLGDDLITGASLFLGGQNITLNMPITGARNVRLQPA